MGFLDELKDKAGELGGKAKEGLGAAKDKAADLIGDVKERLDKDDTEQADRDKAEQVDRDNAAQGPADEPTAGAPTILATGTSNADGLVGDTTFFGPSATSDSAPGDTRDDALDAVQAENEEIRATDPPQG